MIFFLYVLKEHGLPVSDVFDQEIKDLPTSRFSKDFNDDYKVLHSEIKRERKNKSPSAILVLSDEPFQQPPPQSPGYRMTENSEVEPSVFLSERLYFSSAPSLKASMAFLSGGMHPAPFV